MDTAAFEDEGLNVAHFLFRGVGVWGLVGWVGICRWVITKEGHLSYKEELCCAEE